MKQMSKRYMGCVRPGPADAGCWVMVRLYTGSMFGGSTHCGVKPRPGCLTCRYHTQYEQDAQEARAIYTPERIERQRQGAITRITKLEAIVAKQTPSPKGPSPASQALHSERMRLERIEAMIPMRR